MSEPWTDIIFETSDDVFIKQIVLPSRNMMYPQHKHKWDHSTLLVRGSIVLWQVDPLKGDIPGMYYRAPTIIMVPKGVDHKFQTLEDDCLVYCVHNLRGADARRTLEELDLVDDPSS